MGYLDNKLMVCRIFWGILRSDKKGYQMGKSFSFVTGTSHDTEYLAHT